MTFNELKDLSHQISTNIRAFQTVTKLFQLSLYETASIDDRTERLPAIEDISDVLSHLAQQADDVAEKLLFELPSTLKGFKP